MSGDREGEASRAAERMLAGLLTGTSGQDLYQAYSTIRAGTPVLRTRSGTVVLSRNDDVSAALRHPDLGKPAQSLSMRRGEARAEEAMTRWRHTLLFANPPEHTRLRRLISAAFSTRHVEQLRPQVAATIDRYLNRLDGQPGTEFIAAVAQPLPAQVIADMLGIPGDDYHAYAPLVRDLVDLFEPFASPEAVDRAITAQDELGAYLGGLLASKRSHPANDLLSRLVSSRDADALDDTEMTATAVLLFAAGFETTTNLLGNGLHALLTHPGQLAILRQMTGQAPGAAVDEFPRAVEEFLRFDSPVQLTSREALRPCSLAGTEPALGQTVLLLLGAGNRDPARFSDPGLLDVTRDEGPSLSFASGIHYCLGAHLARLEAAEFFSRLLRRFAHLELAGEPQRRPGRSLRGFAELPLTARPR